MSKSQTNNAELWRVWKLTGECTDIRSHYEQRVCKSIIAAQPAQARGIVPPMSPESMIVAGIGIGLVAAYFKMVYLRPRSSPAQTVIIEPASPPISTGPSFPLSLFTHDFAIPFGRYDVSWEEGRRAVWRPAEQSNAFFLMVGGSGSGKTTALRLLARAIHDNKVPVLTLDFHGDVDTPGDRILLSGGASSSIGINPLELDAEEIRETGFRENLTMIRDAVARAIPSIGHVQKGLLMDAMQAAYRAAGIDEEDERTWSKPPPTLDKVLENLSASGIKNAEGLGAMLSDLFGHPIFQRRSHIAIGDLIAKSSRIDMSKIQSDAVRGVAIDTILRRVFRALKTRGPIPGDKKGRDKFRLFVVIDEARHADGAILESIFAEARKFGMGAILASQMADDFSNRVRANASTWLFLQHETISEATKNAKDFGIDPGQLTALNGKGDAYFRIGRGALRRLQVNGD